MYKYYLWLPTHESCIIDHCVLVNILHFINIYNGINNVLHVKLKFRTFSRSITFILFLNLHSLLSAAYLSKVIYWINQGDLPNKSSKLKMSESFEFLLMSPEISRGTLIFWLLAELWNVIKLIFKILNLIFSFPVHTNIMVISMCRRHHFFFTSSEYKGHDVPHRAQELWVR